MPETLEQYIRRRLREKGMSGRAAARAMDVSHSYFFSVITGKIKRPGANFCRKIAELFGESPVTVLRIAGWLPYDDDDEALLEELRVLAKDPDFLQFMRVYRELTPVERRLFVAITKAALEAVERQSHREEQYEARLV